MRSDSSSAECDLAKCCLCGNIEKAFELPGRTEKYCLACSADFASALQLCTEIDAGTLAGISVDPLIWEYQDLTNRMLERAQSTEFGSL